VGALLGGKRAEGLPRREGLAVEVGDEAARAVPDSGWPHVGWCAIEPRPAYTGLARNNHVPWEGRAEDKADEAVWAVTCIFTRVGFRKRGVGRALARAAVEFARERGARAVEAYPMVSKDVIVEELPRRHARHVRRRRPHRGEPSDAATRRDAPRLL
jgi:GNAT superfamily N-acetyltransferase